MKKIISTITAILISGVFVAAPVFASENCTCSNGKPGTRPKTALLKSIGCECGGGESVSSILNFTVDIMSIGIGILGVIGITIVGIQYLTAGGSEEKTRKAKRRMFEIIIGLVLYVLIFAFLKWLLPNVS